MSSVTICSLDVHLSQFWTSLLFISSSNCCFLACIQISQEQVMCCVIPISLRISHSLLWFTQSKILKQKEVFSLKFPCFFYCPKNVGSLISGSSPFSKSSLYTWKFLIHVLLNTDLKDFKYYLAHNWILTHLLSTLLSFQNETLPGDLGAAYNRRLHRA